MRSGVSSCPRRAARPRQSSCDLKACVSRLHSPFCSTTTNFFSWPAMQRHSPLSGSRSAGVVAVGSLALVCLGWCPVEQVSLVLFPSLILLFQIAVPGIYPRLNHALMFLGDLTYASYMIQFPLQLSIVQVAAAAGARIGDLSATPAFLVCWVLSVGALSRLVFVWFERPMQAGLP